MSVDAVQAPKIYLFELGWTGFAPQIFFTLKLARFVLNDFCIFTQKRKYKFASSAVNILLQLKAIRQKALFDPQAFLFCPSLLLEKYNS
jgi:hypothetical protein